MKIALTILLFISMKANAFHAVTEILPGEEASQIDQNCVVAIAGKGLVVDELAAIVW